MTGPIETAVKALRTLCPCGVDHSAEKLFPCACRVCTVERWPICGDSQQMLYDFAVCPGCGGNFKLWTVHGRDACRPVEQGLCCP
jgi:hypothetical protein